MPDAPVAAPVIDLRGFLRSSLIEWEGRVCAVVFTARCNWRCPYCHGAVFVQEPESLQPVTVAEVLAHLRARDGWIDGLAVSGGEPTLQPGLPDFLRAVKAYVPVKLETNGTHPEVIDALLQEGLLDCLCLDYKAPLDERLPRVTGVEPGASALAAVRQSFDLARAATSMEREVHTTLWPGLIDEAVLEEMARELRMPGALWVLQRYEPGDVLDPEMAGVVSFSRDELDALAAVARRHHDRVLLRTGHAV